MLREQTMLKQWSIGIFNATDPLKPQSYKSNPVLTVSQVNDICGGFVADPFLFFLNEKYYLFFEVLNTVNNLGEIGLATSTDGKKWNYEKIIMKSRFHLSYPFIFAHNNVIYMIPECQTSGKVTLYKAHNFPFEWTPISDILLGSHVDSTLVYFNGIFYLFTYKLAEKESDSSLEIWYSDELDKGWKSHPGNPISFGDKFPSRPGGRILNIGNDLYRFVQDNSEYYGKQIYCLKITELSKKSFKQKFINGNKPFLTATGKGWNALGIHTYNCIFANGEYICCGDGLKRYYFVNPAIIINKLLYKFKRIFKW